MRYFIYPYNSASASAKVLAEGLGAKRIKREGSKFKPGPGKAIINWGASAVPYDVPTWNHPDFVSLASNKLSLFKKFDNDESIFPLWSVDHQEAVEWCRAGNTVLCRTLLSSHSGKGIVVAETEEQLVAAPLYVMYKKKKEEYRLHFIGEECFDVQRKARRLDHDEPNWKIRNHANGFIYQRNDFDLPKGVEAQAAKVFKGSGLTFGAVDIIYNAQEGRSYALEINTAPGLTGSTLENYVNAFKKEMV